MEKKIKQILAIIGIIIIVGLYIVTFILAITGNENTKGLFLASIFATVMVPVIIYIIQWLYKLVKKQAEETNSKDLVVTIKDEEKTKNP